jgi:hypothetical protein
LLFLRFSQLTVAHQTDNHHQHQSKGSVTWISHAIGARKRGVCGVRGNPLTPVNEETKIARMPRARKIDLEKVQASLDAVCPTCGKLISPLKCGASISSVSSVQFAASGLSHGLGRPADLFFGPCIYLNARQAEIVDDRGKVRNEV